MPIDYLPFCWFAPVLPVWNPLDATSLFGVPGQVQYLPACLAGTPVAVSPGGTSSNTTAPAPMLAPTPTSIGPISFAPVPMLAPSRTVGPITLPAFRPIVTQGEMTTPE